MQNGKVGWKPKVVLALFGAGLGALLCKAALAFVPLRPEGSEFENLSELRRAMLREPKVDETTRSVSLNGIINPHFDDKVIYDLRPNLDVRFQRVPVRTNSCGMRDPERVVAKRADTYRIAILGDSFTFGWGVEESAGFPQVLERTLNRLVDGKRRVEVLNFGVPGYSTFQEVAKFLETGLEFEPDAVIVFFVQNDFGLPFFVKDFESGRLQPAVSFAKRLWNSEDPRARAQKEQLESFDPNRALIELDQRARERGIKVFVTINPRKTWKREYDKLWALREPTNGLRFISLRDEFIEAVERGNIPEADLTLAHDPHPSPLRHDLYGQLLAPYLLETLS